MRKPRKLKKQIKKAIIIYDRQARPEGLYFEELLKIFYNTGLLMYDSEIGEAPKILNSKLKPRIYTNDTPKN